MAERSNGKAPFMRRTHGFERRGVAAVPNLTYGTRQEQSRADKARLIEMVRERSRARTEAYEGLDLGNKELPAYKHKQEILANVEAYKAIILGGQTGSGKSTQVPQYLYEAGYDMSIVLVPRRVIADGLGERIREEFTEQIPGFIAEEAVGIVHGERSERHENNKIMVMTPNTFVKMEQDLRKEMGDKKVAIISDEIHEANLFTEIATGVAATAVRDLDSWRLIAASATHNAQTLESSFKELNGGYVPTISIEGRPFGVEMEEEADLTPMQVYAKRGYDHEKSMIFTSGKREIDHIIEQTMNEMEAVEKGSSAKVVFRKLHGELSGIELSHINDQVPEGYRTVIVSSPAGMSGITIPGVTMVITDGTINRQELDGDGNPGLVRHYLSKAEIIQQIGRAGRDVEGGLGIVAMPITVADDKQRSRGKTVEFPQMAFVSCDDRPEHAPPEIYSSVLSRVVLSVAAINRRFGDINPYIPHRVAESAIISAEETLYRLGALDENNVITQVGRKMDKFPISPELSRGMYEFIKGKTARQIGRAAFVAAAFDVGGLQDFSDKQNSDWKKLIRPDTADDFIAQLDIMVALENHLRAEKPLYEFVDTYALNPKRVERALKVSRKILGSDVFMMRSDNLIISDPVLDEEMELRNSFTAGLIDLVHEQTGKKSYRKPLYRNIHGDETATQRTISDRSVTKPENGQLIAGVPRWYEKTLKNNEKVRFNIIESTLLVDPEVVGRYAKENGLLQGHLVAPHVEGDRIVDREQMMFGSIKVGTPVASVSRENIPEVSQALLVEQALQRPGEAQRALREIAIELETYKERIPLDVLEEYRTPDAPSDLTKEFIATLVQEHARHTRSLSEIDARLAQYVYSKNVTINRYFDDEAREALRLRAPDTVVIGKTDARVFYDKGQPYITHTSREQRVALFGHGPVYLEDGREVLLQLAAIGGGTRRVSLGGESEA